MLRGKPDQWNWAGKLNALNFRSTKMNCGYTKWIVATSLRTHQNLCNYYFKTDQNWHFKINISFCQTTRKTLRDTHDTASTFKPNRKHREYPILKLSVELFKTWIYKNKTDLKHYGHLTNQLSPENVLQRFRLIKLGNTCTKISDLQHKALTNKIKYELNYFIYTAFKNFLPFYVWIPNGS